MYEGSSARQDDGVEKCPEDAEQQVPLETLVAFDMTLPQCEAVVANMERLEDK